MLTPVNNVIASSVLWPSLGYESRHLCQIPRTLNFGMKSTCMGKQVELEHNNEKNDALILPIMDKDSSKHLTTAPA